MLTPLILEQRGVPNERAAWVTGLNRNAAAAD